MNRTSRSWTDRLKEVLPDLATMLLVIVAYLPAYQAQFIWDDGAHLTQNPYITGTLGFRGIWTSAAATYYPLVLTSFWIQHAIWGLNPFPYHLVNVLVHGLCAVLLRRVLLNLNAGSAAAWLGAALWALHPVQVETVAWITELKNTQSCVFYLASILFFFKWRSRPDSDAKSRYILYSLFLLSFACALLSKTSTVMLPVVLVLCAWWLDRSWNWKTLRGLLPLFSLSAVAAGWTIWEQIYHSGAHGSAWLQSFPERLAIAGRSIWFYFGKLIWPQPLIFLYPRWNVNPANLLSFFPILAVAAALFVCWWFRERWGRAPFFAAAYFVVSLFPVLDFFNVYFFRYSFVGDHFQYLASMGPLALAGAGIVRAFDVRVIQEWRGNRWILAGVSCVLIAILATLTSAHAEIFQNDEKLWAHTIADNPDAWLAHDNLAAIYLGRDNLLDAITQLDITLKLYPNYAEGQATLAMALYESGDVDEAIRHLRLSLQQQPSFNTSQVMALRERTHNYLGEALMTKGVLNEAISEISEAVAINPHDVSAQENLAIALARSGKVGEALPHYSDAVQGAPESVDHRMNYGKALLFQTQYADAAAQFSAVLDLDPSYEPGHKYLGIALSGLHRSDEAVNQLTEALRLDPRDTEAQQKLEEIKAAQPHRSR